jgi:hypothetical protein
MSSLSTKPIDTELLVKRMASFSPEDLLMSLGRLVATEAATMDQAEEVYTAVRRRQIVMVARQAVLDAAERVVVHGIRSIGHMRTAESEGEAKGIRLESHRLELEGAVDHLIAETRRASKATWNLVAIGGGHGSQASPR